MTIEFKRSFTRFGLLSDKYVFCILEDQKPSVHDQKNLIAMTGAELVKVHGEEHFVMLEEIKEIEPTHTDIDTSVINRPGAFKGVRQEKLRPPIDVEFTPNITTEYTRRVKSTVFRNQEGQIFDMPPNLRSDEQAQIAKLMNARFVVVLFQVTTTFLPKASPWRSQSKY